MDPAQVRTALSNHIVLGFEVVRHAAGKMWPGGTLVLMGGTGGRRVGHGLGIPSAANAALPPFAAALAPELAPVQVNPIAVGFADTRCRHRCSETTSRSTAASYGRRYQSAASSPPPTPPRSPSTS